MAACVRVPTFSCRKIADTWSLIVLGERRSKRAISAFVLPIAKNLRISICRGVKASNDFPARKVPCSTRRLRLRSTAVIASADAFATH